VEQHDGSFPSDAAAARRLPGVGAYTAGAVLSIAYGLSEPIVDGNAARVLARLFVLPEPLGSPALARRLWELARRLVPPGDPGHDVEVSPASFNQGLMELGATVCLARVPRCLLCPLRADCGALAIGRVDELPTAARRRRRLDVRLEVLVARRGGAVLLAERPAVGRMARMWELPTRELVERGAEARLWPARFPGGAGEDVLAVGAELALVRHSITHHRIVARVLRAWEREPSAGAPAGDVRWVAEAELSARPVTGMTRKVLARVGAYDPPTSAVATSARKPSKARGSVLSGTTQPRVVTSAGPLSPPRREPSRKGNTRARTRAPEGSSRTTARAPAARRSSST
jgi:A/G-specific adenine glycosylase